MAEGAQRACQTTGLQLPERSSAAVRKYPQSPIIIIVIAIITIIIIIILLIPCSALSLVLEELP